jgi:hypothetical protein
VDPTIHLGKEQLFLLLGVRSELLATLERPLTMADVNVLGVEVQSRWTGATIAEFIQRNLDERPGLRLVYAVCDQGTNILATLRQLTIPVVSDCSHVMMNLVKKLLRFTLPAGRPEAGADATGHDGCVGVGVHFFGADAGAKEGIKARRSSYPAVIFGLHLRTVALMH